MFSIKYLKSQYPSKFPSINILQYTVSLTVLKFDKLAKLYNFYFDEIFLMSMVILNIGYEDNLTIW